MGDAGEARLVRFRAGLPVAGDAQHDESRVHRSEVFPTDPPAFEGPRPKVLEQHIGFGHQRLQKLDTGLLA